MVALQLSLATGLVVPHAAVRSVRLPPPAAAALRVPVMTVALSQNSLPAPPALPSATSNKVINTLSGLWFAVSATVIVIACYIPLIPFSIYSFIFDAKKRRLVDLVVKMWARASLMFLGAKVQVIGAENLPPPGEAALYCPNHSSFLDIFVLSAYLPRYIKYISKIEILRIPLIGWAMQLARHIPLRRSDRRSQMETFREAVASLQAGNNVIAFPEGTRSKDGRPIAFKKGPFTMAAKAGTRVVPISIIGTHVFQPTNAVVPLAPPRGISIVCHPPLDVPVAKAEGESADACKAAILSALPPEMQPLE